MTRIMIDREMRDKLLNVIEPVELCDASGKVLGRFLPSLDPSLYTGLEPRISREELQRRMKNKGETYTTQEVLRHLKRL
jgi:hypothetical protein